MQSFSIGDVELLTGIKSSTLRIWEKRYSFFRPSRKENQRRAYSDEDLQKLLHISFLYHNGWKVSNIACLPEETIAKEIGKIKLENSNYKTYVQRLLSAAISFNEAAFASVLNSLIDKVGFEKNRYGGMLHLPSESRTCLGL